MNDEITCGDIDPRSDGTAELSGAELADAARKAMPCPLPKEGNELRKCWCGGELDFGTNSNVYNVPCPVCGCMWTRANLQSRPETLEEMLERLDKGTFPSIDWAKRLSNTILQYPSPEVLINEVKEMLEEMDLENENDEELEGNREQ